MGEREKVEVKVLSLYLSHNKIRSIEYVRGDIPGSHKTGKKSLGVDRRGLTFFPCSQSKRRKAFSKAALELCKKNLYFSQEDSQATEGTRTAGKSSLVCQRKRQLCETVKQTASTFGVARIKPDLRISCFQERGAVGPEFEVSDREPSPTRLKGGEDA